MAETGVPRRELEVEVAGGRILVEIAGPEDGALVIHHNGTPGGRRLYDGHLRAGVERGLRHACYSRPGYEGSERRPGRIFADCAEESAAVADALGADRFYVFGVSGGGPPALACAALLPERVLSAAVFAGFVPQDAEGVVWQEGMVPANIREYAALEAGDEPLYASIEALAAEMVADDTENFGDALEEGFCEADRRALRGAYRDHHRRAVRSIVAGGLWGWFDDDKAAFTDWGFDPAGISVPVSLWHGGEDPFVPPAHGEWLAQRIPGARLHSFPEHGHVSLFAELYPEALDELIATAAERPGGNICSSA